MDPDCAACELRACRLGGPGLHARDAVAPSELARAGAALVYLPVATNECRNSLEAAAAATAASQCDQRGCLMASTCSECSHCLGSGSSAIVPFVGATFAAAVLNPRLLPHRVFNFLIRRRTHQIEIEQGWNPQQRMDGTGACVWDAAITLCDHLCERPQLVEGRRVVELGSGCGVLSIVAARLGARCVHATDLEQALLLLARNVWLNEAAAGQAQGGDAGGGVTVGCCNWGNALHAERVRAQCPGERVDLILGSDLVYQLKEESQESRERQARSGTEDRSASVALLSTIAAVRHLAVLLLSLHEPDSALSSRELIKRCVRMHRSWLLLAILGYYSWAGSVSEKTPTF